MRGDPLNIGDQTPITQKDNCLFRVPAKHHKRLRALCADYPNLCDTCLERFSSLQYRFTYQSQDTFDLPDVTEIYNSFPFACYDWFNCQLCMMESVRKLQMQSKDEFSIPIDKCLFEKHTLDLDKINAMCVSFPFVCEDCLERITSLKYRYEVQSADVIVTDAQPMDKESQENLEFIDESAGMQTGFSRVEDPNSINDETPLDLTNFLSRPVKIASFTWAEADAIGTVRSFQPWDLFFNDTRIKKKLDNFAFIQCNLKVKVMINASPFYYGAMIANYLPLPVLTPSTAVADANFRYFIPISQRPHMWIYPQNNEGAEMTLPYFNFRNWLRVQIRSDFTDFGTLDFVNYTVLDSANGAVGTGVTVTVYAWAEDVKVSGMTTGLSMQSSDEYGTGPVSKPASAIAYVAGALENVPIIGKFATVTRIGASAISSIASMFGFTNVPVVAPVHAFRPAPYPHYSNVDIGYPIEKLTVDCKNELSVDPSIVGLPPTDELIISNLAKKESFLTTSTWASSDAVDKILFTSMVTPNLYNASTASNPSVFFTPISWLSQMFKSWRGDIIFRFKFICSQYHKGRVRISYDPAGTAAQNLTADATTSTVVFTKIVDLNKDTDVEIRVPYQQAISWLLVQASTPSNANIVWSTSGAPAYIFDPQYFNGTIQMRVLNALTSPIATSSVRVNVFVRAAENFELANPIELANNFSNFTVQSRDVYGNPDDLILGSSTSCHDKYLVNWGESVLSLRAILRRFNLSSVWCQPQSIVDDKYTMIRQRFTRWPPYYGYDPNGINSAKGIIAPASNFNFNYSQVTVYNWIAPAFIGQRGSMIWSFNTDSAKLQNSVKVIRVPQNPGAAVNTITSFVGGTASADTRYFRSVTEAQSNGSALTSQQTQFGLTVLCPNYSQYRFQTTTPGNASNPSVVDGSDQDNLLLEISPTSGSTVSDTQILKIWKYVSIGTDYNLHFFINCPVYNLLSALPTAN